MTTENRSAEAARDAAAARKPLLRALALGLALFAAGLVLAHLTLPEWQAPSLPDRGLFERRYREIARELGLRPAAGRPHVRLTVVDRIPTVEVPATDRLAPRAQALSVEVFHPAARPGEAPRQLEIVFARDGRAVAIAWTNLDPSFLTVPPRLPADRELAERMTDFLLEPGEAVGEATAIPIPGGTGGLNLKRPMGSGSPARVTALVSGLEISAERRIRSLKGNSSAFYFGLVFPVVYAVLFGFFFYLAVRRQISIVNGAVLAALVIPTLDWVYAWDAGQWLPFALGALIFAWYFILWSTAESLMRTVDPDSTAGLDAVRAGRFSRRAGRAVLLGLAFGAGLGGFHLLVHALGFRLPEQPWYGTSVHIPFLSSTGGMISDALWLAVWAVFSLALASRLLPARWVLPVSALALAWFGPFDLPFWGARVGANLVFAAVLVYVGRRHGLTALLTASLAAVLLPATAFALEHVRWIPFAPVLPVLCVLLAGQSLRALSRPFTIDEETRVRPPAFVRRMAEERRFQYELDLLARMQLGLLPQELPRIEGYELAARSILATEAGGDLYDFHRDADGGLWITAGDVAGHGYSCAVSQAMIKAALASLIPSRRSPAAVLGHLHRVLKEGGPARNFTTLALLRLQPETGEVLLANAGHPAPFLAAGGETEELTLPGLPLGQGPPRQYREARFLLPPGGALLFTSDGLFEARDADGEFYPLERVSEILRTEQAESRAAGEILDRVLEDWRRHQGAGPPADDTTLVLIHRTAAVTLAA